MVSFVAPHEMSLLRTLVRMAVPALALCAWPPGSVRRGFYATSKGALHYVVRGNVSAAPPLVFFHAHPRSTEQVRVLADEIPISQPLIAVDYFGVGSSDECICDEAVDEFVPYTTFAKMVLEICNREGVGKMIPLGSLTGASGAYELAWLAAKEGRCDTIVQYEAYYLSPRAKNYIDTSYIPTIRHLPVNLNGSHLLFWWNKPDAGPIGPTKMAPVAADLMANQQKTMDSLSMMRTGWQFKMGYTAYNDLIPGRLADLVHAGVRPLCIGAAAREEPFPIRDRCFPTANR